MYKIFKKFIFIIILAAFFTSCDSNKMTDDDYEVLSAVIYKKPLEKPDTNYYATLNLHPKLMDTTWYTRLRTIVEDHFSEIPEVEEIIADMERKKSMDIVDIGRIKSSPYQKVRLVELPKKIPKRAGIFEYILLYSVIGYNKDKTKAIILHDWWRTRKDNASWGFYLERNDEMKWEVIKRSTKSIS